MVPVPLADRLVEVIADRGEAAAERYVYGSGCIVRGRTVLTAAHVVAGAQRVQVRDPNKGVYSATVDPHFVGDANGPGPDLALVEIDDPGVDLAPLGLARVDRRSPRVQSVKECHAIGYPWFAETPSPTAMRDTVDAEGIVPTLSKLAAGLLSVQVNNSPRPLPPKQVRLGESEWSGMSGGPVVAADRLLGVVTEHAPREGPSAITAVPLTALEQDPSHPRWGPGVKDPSAWWVRLGVTGLPDLLPLPALPERPTPAYWATVREFGRTLHRRMPQLLGRERELADIAAFATGPAGYRWLVGGAYAGKTALLYEAVAAGLPEEVDVVCHFLSCRASDADSSRFLAAVVPQLAYLCELDPPVGDRDQFYALWERATERAAEAGRPLLLVVDGLDEDSRPAGLPSVASLLPAVEGRAHVLVSSRPYPELPGDVKDEDPLKSTATRVDLTPFEGAEELAELARQEIYDLTHGADVATVVEVLGLLTAAAGPLSVQDLATLSDDLAPPSAAHRLRVRRLVTELAARSLEPVGPAEQARWQFAHFSLLQYARANQDLADPEYHTRIHRWAEQWRDRGWPTSPDPTQSTPRYLLDAYPSALAGDPSRLTALVSDVGWVNAAIQSTGVDRVLAGLRLAAAADHAPPAVAAMLATVSGQAHYLRPPLPVTQPGYVLRQLCLQASELGEDRLASDLRARLQSLPDSGLIPIWTTRRTSHALSAELGLHGGSVGAVAVLADGRVVSGGGDGRLLVWDPSRPGSRPVERGRHRDSVNALAVLADGRVVSGGGDGRLLVWDLSQPGSVPVERGRHGGSVGAVAELGDGRVVSGGGDGRLVVWDPSRHGSPPVELGRHGGSVAAVAVLADGRVVSGGGTRRVLVWDPSQAGSDPVVLGEHDSTVVAVAALPDGRVFSEEYDGWAMVWDLSQPGSDPVVLGGQDEVAAVAALPDGRVVTGGRDGRVLVWAPSTGESAAIELGRHDSWVKGVAVAALPDGRVVTGGGDGRVLVWDPSRASTGAVRPSGYGGSLAVVAVLADGRVVSGGDDGRLLVWDPSQPGSDPMNLGRHDRLVRAVAGLADGRVVSGGRDHRLLVWDPSEPGSDPVELGLHDDWVVAVAALPDGRVVVSSGGDDYGRLLVWDPSEPGSDPVELDLPLRLVRAVAVLPDGRVVSGLGRPVLVWDPSQPGSDPVELGRHDDWVVAVAALADGRVVSGGHDGRLVVWNPSRPGANPVELGRHDSLVAVAALADGRVVSGGGDRRVLTWVATTQGPVAQLGCSVIGLAAVETSDGEASFIVVHEGQGFSLWSVTEGTTMVHSE